MTQYLDKAGLATFKELADKAYVHNEAEAITSELYAKESIYGDHIYKGTIWGYHIHNSTISAKNLMRESVETEKIKDGAVTAQKLDGSVYTAITKHINTNSFYIIDGITTEDFPGGSTTSNVSRTIYCKGYLLGSLNGSPVNNYPNKEQFGIVEKVNDTISLPKAPINALYFNTKDGLLYYNAGTELRKIFDDVNEASPIGATLGLLSISDYDTIMSVVDGAPTETITSAEIDQLFG